MADQDDKKTNPLEELPAPLEPEKQAEATPELSLESQNVLKEFDSTGLEVADMPESNELQERRRKTKNRLRELSDVGEPPSDDESAETFEDEEGGLMDLFREANISKRQVGFCCGGVLVVILLGGLIYGGLQWWNNRPTTPTETTTTTPPETTPTTPSTTVSPIPDDSIQAGVKVGQSSTPDGTTGAGEDLGTAASSEDELTQQIVDFSKIYEAMQTDVNQLLDQSTDRTQALSDYEGQLNYLLYVGQQNEQKLSDESDALVAQYNKVDTQKAVHENAFFDKLRNLDAYASAAALNGFIADGQESVKLRAYYQARQKLLSYYQQEITFMSARIQDVKLNEQALIEGIKIVDISGSDINLIIDGSSF